MKDNKTERYDGPTSAVRAAWSAFNSVPGIAERRILLHLADAARPLTIRQISQGAAVPTMKVEDILLNGDLTRWLETSPTGWTRFTTPALTETAPA